MRAAFNPKSGNAKTGPIAVYETSSDTCPRSCGQYDTCYAKQHHAAGHWKGLDNGTRGFPLHELYPHLRALPARSFVRGNQWGDQPGMGETINPEAFRALVASVGHLTAWTYTHKPPTGQNAREIRSANALGFTVNLSADTPEQADAFSTLGIGPVVVVLGHAPACPALGKGECTCPKFEATPKGRKIVICPAQTITGVTCLSCGNGKPLCARPTRTYIIGFRAHGATRGKIQKRLNVIQELRD